MKTKKHKFLYRTLIVVGSVLGISLMGLPWFFSTSVGTKFLVSFVRPQGSLSLENLSLHWFGPQEIKGIRYSSKGLLFTCDAIDVQSSLFSLLINPESSSVCITSPACQLFPEELQINSPILTSKPSQGSFTLPFPPLQLSLLKLLHLPNNLSITQGSLQFLPKENPPILLESIDLSFSSDKINETFSLQVHAKSLSGTQTGLLSLHAKSQEKGEVLFDANISNLPLDGVDALIALISPKHRGLLVELIGPELSCQCQSAISFMSYKGEAQIQSRELEISLSFHTKSNNIILRSPSIVRAQIPPRLSSLPTPIHCSLQVDSLSLRC